MFGLQNIGMPEILVVAVLLLIIFGPKKLPELAKGITQAIKEISTGLKGGDDSKKNKKQK